ncbi:hypothetical protein B0H19DRAFT_1080878 [Mycena capillaripes]|nr:hypothetical protein B0H19DRAFT_1080878 [Mycena capillaripes]
MSQEETEEILQNGIIHDFDRPDDPDTTYPTCSVPFFPGDAFPGPGFWEIGPLNFYYLVTGHDERMRLVKNARTSYHHGLYGIARAIYKWCKFIHAHPIPERSSACLQKTIITNAFDLTTYDHGLQQLRRRHKEGDIGFCTPFAAMLIQQRTEPVQCPHHIVYPTPARAPNTNTPSKGSFISHTGDTFQDEWAPIPLMLQILINLPGLRLGPLSKAKSKAYRASEIGRK